MLRRAPAFGAAPCSRAPFFRGPPRFRMPDKGIVKGSGLPGEEERDVRKAGAGVKGDSLGGAHTGRDASRPEADLDKERKGRRT